MAPLADIICIIISRELTYQQDEDRKNNERMQVPVAPLAENNCIIRNYELTYQQEEDRKNHEMMQVPWRL